MRALDAKPDDSFLRRIPHDFARRHLLLLVQDDVNRGEMRAEAGEDSDASEHSLLVCDRTDPAAVHNACCILGVWPEMIVCDAEQLAERIDHAYEHAAEPDQQDASSNTSDTSAADIDDLIAAAERDLLSTEGKGDVVRLVDGLLFEAVRRGASDLHVQPLPSHGLVRFRVDGVLLPGRRLDKRLLPAIASRIKVMARLDIAETRLPQDGRTTVTIGQQNNSDAEHASSGGRAIDLRISTLPTSYGERIVVRLLDTDRGSKLCTLDGIGMPGDVARTFRSLVSRPNGIVLLTGPTGSGKTTTLYATLRWVATTGGAGGGGELNIMTIEDPVEYELSTDGVAISQSQINTKKGVTFASGLRHILRQDPDVIMVGEIRDADTARIAIQSSLTGHLVLSTLHTNDAASAVTRLVDLGVEPYLVSSSLSAVVAQRLVRRTHAPCDGKGCAACNGTGFLGRAGIFEMLVVDDTIRQLVHDGATTEAIRSHALRSGMRSLHADGMRLLGLGETTRAEIERVTIGTDDDALALERDVSRDSLHEALP